MWREENLLRREGALFRVLGEVQQACIAPIVVRGHEQSRRRQEWVVHQFTKGFWWVASRQRDRVRVKEKEGLGSVFFSQRLK